MSKINQRDEAKRALASMISSASAPGADQAKISAVELPKEIEVALKKPVKMSDTISQKKNLVKVAEKNLPVVTGEGKAEKISISLHPEDLERLEHFENSLRSAGCIGRRAPTSFLLKVALAAIEGVESAKLSAAVTEVTAQDGRRK